MNEVGRILNRFKIPGRGILYIIKFNQRSNLKLGDVLYDLRGNQFRIIAFEMIRRSSENIGSQDELSQGIMFEFINGNEVQGNILVKEIQNINFIFCNHPLYQHKVDADYKDEYDMARLNNACSLFSYEELLKGKVKLYGDEIQGLTIYRGWMLKPQLYRKLYDELEQRGIILINSPEEYEYCHLLPGWYEDFKDQTAFSVWSTENYVENVVQMTEMLEGSYIVKDYVKSRKHEWYDACYIPNICDKEQVKKVVNNFVTRQGDELVGGVALRKFIELKQMGYHKQSGMPLSEEYRVFVYAGKILTIDNYWTENENVKLTEEECQWIASVATKVKSNFATIDVARRTDGTLIIMELGDGQVSGLQQLGADIFYNALNEKK